MSGHLLRTVLWTTLVALLGVFVVAVDGQEKGKKGIQAKDLAGKYRAACTNPDGTKDVGTVEIEWLEGNKVKFTSFYGKTDVGFGKLKGDTLSVEYRGKKKTERTGEAEYKVMDIGVLEGWWHYIGFKKTTEKLTPTKKKNEK
jgi:hypothetical protein